MLPTGIFTGMITMEQIPVKNFTLWPKLMKIFKPCIHRFIPNHPYNNKVLILSTYNESKKEGKIYMYYINEVNGMIDIASEKVFEGFGEILDMEYNYPKYGT